MATEERSAVKTCPHCGRPFDGHMHAGGPCDLCEARADGMADPGRAKRNIRRRLEYLRGQLRAECMSYSELAQLQGLAGYIDPGDLELLEAAGVPEQAEWLVPFEDIQSSYALAMKSAGVAPELVAEIQLTVRDYAVNNLGDD